MPHKIIINQEDVEYRLESVEEVTYARPGEWATDLPQEPMDDEEDVSSEHDDDPWSQRKHDNKAQKEEDDPSFNKHRIATYRMYTAERQTPKITFSIPTYEEVRNSILKNNQDVAVKKKLSSIDSAYNNDFDRFNALQKIYQHFVPAIIFQIDDTYKKPIKPQMDVPDKMINPGIMIDNQTVSASLASIKAAVTEELKKPSLLKQSTEAVLTTQIDLKRLGQIKQMITQKLEAYRTGGLLGIGRTHKQESMALSSEVLRSQSLDEIREHVQIAKSRVKNEGEFIKVLREIDNMLPKTPNLEANTDNSMRMGR